MKITLKELQNFLPEEYYNQGLVGLASWLIEKYIHLYYKKSECDYIIQQKAYIVLIELLDWLLENYHQTNKYLNFNFEKEFKKADKQILDIKKKIYKLWTARKFPTELKRMENIIEEKNITNSLDSKMLYSNLLRLYRIYRKEDKYLLLLELGL